MFFGRNEEGGLRCAYHGWKFDVEGNCLDMPNIPEDQRFTERVKAEGLQGGRSSAAWSGSIWASARCRRRCRRSRSSAFPMNERMVMCHQRDCNWLQSLEGDIDTSHFGFLHVGAVKPDDVDPKTMHRWAWSTARRATTSRRPTGARCTRPIARPIPATCSIASPTSCSPCFAMVPDGTFSNMIQATLSVPLDDSHTMTYVLAWSKREQALRTLKDGSSIPGAALLATSCRPPPIGWAVGA